VLRWKERKSAVVRRKKGESERREGRERDRETDRGEEVRARERQQE